MSSETTHPLLPSVARRLKRKWRRSKRRPASSAYGCVLSVAEMRERLTAWRAAADEDGAGFVLLASGTVPRASRILNQRLAEKVVARSPVTADALGWLPDRRLGVLIGWHVDDDASGRAGDILVFERLLADARSGPVVRYEYPLPAAPEAAIAGRNWPQVCEGGIECCFARPTPFWKRSIDASVAATALVLLAPLLAVVALLIKFTSRGPVLFRQLRTGHGGKPFWMYKFRSMVDGADAEQAALQHLNVQDGPAFKIPCDPRVTRIGWWLRETCVDELPQLWNVLRGEMSLVGPRPLPCHESAACTGWRRQRLDVLPGITCLWQARGRSATSFDDWMRLDVSYALCRSFPLDLAILVGTLPLMFPRVRRATRVQEACERSPQGDNQGPRGIQFRASQPARDAAGCQVGVVHSDREAP